VLRDQAGGARARLDPDFDDDPDEVALEHGVAFMGITRVTRVVDRSTGTTVDAPEDLFAWLSEHSALTVERTEAVTIAGLPGMMREATVAHSTETFAYPTGNMRATAGDRTRFYVLTLDGPDLTIVVQAPPAEFDAMVEEVEAVLESLEVTS
jgi:hypothetical protein